MFLDKKVIIFDLDGTLIDSIGIWNATDRKLMKILSSNEDFETNDIKSFRDGILSTYNSGNIYLNYCRFLGEMFNSSLSAEEILHLRWEISTQFFRELKYKPDAPKTLKLLRENGLKLVLATTGTKQFVDICREENENIIKSANFDKTFSLIVTREDVKENKPSPEIHLKVMELLNVTPEECLVVEDSLMGVQSAKNAGIDVVTIYDKFNDNDREAINEISKYNFEDYGHMVEVIKDEISKQKNG